ncbi:RRM domain-containing protein [Meloidogyne graminicola]|uniref:RRM domain-containing protein n=1 Tax=Meloidogyne graminicola TaxID=189291 RepID=A0A8S9ZVT9_9BILA|nr:RRM domain-containing protein [Meloidogyne graminicola]
MRFASRLLANQIFDFGIQKAQKSSTIYLKNVKWVTGKTQLKNHFNRYGKINDVSLFFDPKTGLHRGFASITFSNSDSADGAIRGRPHFIDGSEVLVDNQIPLDRMKHDKFSTHDFQEDLREWQGHRNQR